MTVGIHLATGLDGRLRTHGGSPHAGGKGPTCRRKGLLPAVVLCHEDQAARCPLLSSGDPGQQPALSRPRLPQGPTEGFPSNGSPSLETEGHPIVKVKGIDHPSPNFKSMFLQNFSKFTLQLTHRKLGRKEQRRGGDRVMVWNLLGAMLLTRRNSPCDLHY